MKKFEIILFLLISVPSSLLFGQFDAGMLRFPDVSQTQIVFAYANDLWLVPKSGGEAVRLSSPPGQELFPRFSPDGKEIAFTANYDGNNDVYVMPVTGGLPVRLTSHGYTDRVIDWTPQGDRVLFASGRESGKARFNQFYTISRKGGPASKLPLEYAEYGSYSPDGNQMAVVYISQVFRNWKRYKGGTKGKIVIYNFRDSSSYNISPATGGGDEFPMWYGDALYFMSDRGTEERMNLYKYDFKTRQTTQLTHYADYDIHYPALGKGEIIFEQNGSLHLYNIASSQDKIIPIQVITDEAALKPKLVNTSDLLQSVSAAPDGNRVIIEARGDIYSLPAAEGIVKNLTQTSGVAERTPTWSPNGKSIAYWSDATGEYELYIRDADGKNAANKVTSYGAGYRYVPMWSPDSKKIAFIDKAGVIQIFELASGKTYKVDELYTFAHYTTAGFKANWSPDSRYLAYARGIENANGAAFIYDFDKKVNHQVTSGFYSTDEPVFDPSGKYLFVTSNQSLSPRYSDFDNTFIYTNSTRLAAITLAKDSSSLLLAVNDTVAIKKENAPAKPTEKSNEKKKKDSSKDKTAEVNKDAVKPVKIDFDGLESRLELLPTAAGSMGSLNAIPGKVIYLRYSDDGSSLKYFDLIKKEEKTIADKIGGYEVTADNKKILINKDGKYSFIDINENAKIDKSVPVKEMQANINPRQEWQQIFDDAWRIERDYFYDANMHGVDWNLVRTRYNKMLQSAATREDVAFIIGEMIGELNASHTYYGGGDLEDSRRVNTGYLGINWLAEGNHYKVDRIIQGASWDAETRSPLDQPGIDIRPGDVISAVNGIPITTDNEPYYYFSGLAGKTVELTYSSSRFQGNKSAIVELLGDEYRLRNLAWIENMRQRVDRETNGEAGYVYVPSTGLDGQNELIRMFRAQITKKALIIDERFNNGGQIPDRFIEMLDRKPLVYWATRDGEAWQWPPQGHFGPKVMLINGWSGSGGDAFPDYFRKRGLGPLIGTRTWGGLIGISGTPQLIDGAGVTAPTFRMYNLDGTWFKEGHGVDPDIEVDENLGAFAHGEDVQLSRAIKEIKRLLIKQPFTPPQRPQPEKR